jgi:LCP family protein required for cell wall assembly
MRTTLKRGIGRGAEINGNGRAILPPGALTPVTIYRQPPPSKPGLASQIGKFFGWLVIAVLMLVVGLVGGFYLWAHESAAALRAHSPDAKLAQTRLDPVPDPKHPATALVIGYDHRAGERGLPSRSDTMMLIRADPVSKTISLLSFPRDLIVPLYCPGKGNGAAVPQGSGRINSAYALCGSSGALETVRHLTNNLQINYLISVNFLGFIAVVNKLGGVWMDIDRRYYNKNVGTLATDFANIDLQPGYQRMTGKQALDFVRYRHTDSDLYRLARQQQFVSAMRQQIASSIGPSSLVRIVNTIAHHQYVEIGVGGGSQFDLGTVYSYAKFAYGLPSGHVFRVTLNGVTGYNELSTSQTNIDDAVQDFLNPDVAASNTATAVALGRKVHRRTLPPKTITVTVLNGNGRTGSASEASFQLGQKGYSTVLPPGGQPANAPNWNYFNSKIYYDPSKPGRGKLAAQQVARYFGSADVEPMPPKIANLSNGALLVVIVGSTFHDQLAPIVVPQAPTRQPPYVRFDPGETRPTLFNLRRRNFPFRLQLPTVLERSSTLDSGTGETPWRVYTMGGQPTLRLTYRTGSSQYWGIQETKWVDAPVLSDRSLTRFVKGRRYDLYYSGSHLHMVVLRSGGASYWVVNTLLDSLSNETMLAIARGLRPYGR